MATDRDTHTKKGLPPGAMGLVLSRQRGHQIIIDERITVTVAEIRGDKVKLGIKAPKSVSVYRREVAERRTRQAKDEGSIGQSQ